MDPVTKTLFTPFEPLIGEGLVAGARWHKALGRNMVLQQGFRPHADELKDRGFISTPGLPAAGEFLHAFVVMPKNVEESRYETARVLGLIRENGIIVVAGANDAGGRRAKSMLERFGVTDVQEFAANHARVAWGVAKGANEAVQQALDEGAPRLVEKTGFVSQPGLFSWDKIDVGSQILAECLPDNLSGNGADFGCGYGFLSRHVLQKYELRNFHCLDADHRAVELCRENLKEIKTKVHYAWEDLSRGVPVRDLDFIVMNPPFHEGKETDADIGKKFIGTACNALRQGGQLWMVANAGLPYEKTLKELFSSCEKITERHGFKVFRAVR